MPFRDRTDAGRRLAQQLQGRRFTSPVVLGLPRGGLPVAAEVAAALGAPLDVFVARKIGAPGHEELAIGAVAEGLEEPVVSEVARGLGVGPRELAVLADRARRELDHRVASYRGQRPLVPLTGRDVVLVDDGLATGMTARAALCSLRAWRPSWLLLAVPVCAPDTRRRLADVADEVVCVEAPTEFWAVGQWYRDFTQVTDQQVREVLAGAGTAPRPVVRSGVETGVPPSPDSDPTIRSGVDTGAQPTPDSARTSRPTSGPDVGTPKSAATLLQHEAAWQPGVRAVPRPGPWHAFSDAPHSGGPTQSGSGVRHHDGNRYCGICVDCSVL